MSVQKSLKRAHASSFAISLVINGLLIFALLTFVNLTSEPPIDETTFRISPPEDQPEIEDPPELEEIDPLDNLEEITFETDFSFESPTNEPLESQEVVEQVTQTDVAEMAELMSDISSPVTMSNIMIGRTSAGRRSAMGRYGNGLGGVTEPAVMKALEWLASVQEKNGKHKGAWLYAKDDTTGTKGRANSGVTGLALLTFLAHGETPSSKQFGTTVANGIRYLIDNQDSEGIFQPAGSHTGYGHAMATYAIAEAYTMTGNVLLEEPLERALQVMYNGYNSTGGYDYDYEKGKNSKYGFIRSDNSLTAWHLQAMKAARISGVGGSRNLAEIQNLMNAMLAVSAKTDDGLAFAYTNSKKFREEKAVGHKTVTAASALCLQLSGRGRSREGRDAMDYLTTVHMNDDLMPEWGKEVYVGYGGAINLWYYTIQALFHDDPDGRHFKKYMANMAKALVSNQRPEGNWVCYTKEGKNHSSVYTTTLGALSLMVYYRHLPTTQAENIEAYQAEPEPLPEEDEVKFSI